VTERFIKSLKDEWLRRVIIPLRVKAMGGELAAHTAWFNKHRPHQALNGCTPCEIYADPAILDLSPCTRSRHERSTIHNVAEPLAGLQVVATHHEGRRHLPIIELKRAA
jgi:hypothetical protein